VTAAHQKYNDMPERIDRRSVVPDPADREEPLWLPNFMVHAVGFLLWALIPFSRDWI
jgi:hypothetical protein